MTEMVSEAEEGLPVTQPLPLLALSGAAAGFDGSPEPPGAGRTGNRSVSMTELPRKASAGSKEPHGRVRNQRTEIPCPK